jgi:NAD+ synthase (glutamine-hydrolysing)
VSYVYANLLGNEAGRVVYDGGALIASEGEIIAAGQRLAFVDRQLTTAVVDVDATRLVRSRQTSFVTAVDDELGACVVDGWAPPPVTLAREPLPDLGWEGAADRKEEEFGRAVALALCDYLRKSRSRGVVVSLSGGADSAAVACLARLAWDLGVQTHGESAFLQRMHLAPGTGFADFCTCVYQATANSGPVTEAAARELATGIGATFHRIDVEDLVSGYRQRIEGMLERPLDWGRDDIALQNIQARVRAPSVWMLTNCLGFLLLSTSNRSEAAVGYATMDGDTCGSLSPIAGIDKAFLRKWLVWFHNTGCFGLAPQPALAGVTAQVPTAELRPRSAGQTDEDDLMPYPVLDAIERMAIRDKRPPRDCLALLRLDFPDYNGDTLRAWVKRFFSGVEINGSGSVMPPVSILMMKTSIPRPGAVFPFCRVDSPPSWMSWMRRVCHERWRTRDLYRSISGNALPRDLGIRHPYQRQRRGRHRCPDTGR